MFRWRVAIVFIFVHLTFAVSYAQSSDGDYSYDEDMQSGVSFDIIEVDTTLFRMSSILDGDSYADATRYYFAPGYARRRGLYYTTADYVVAPIDSYRRTLVTAPDEQSVALYATNHKYNIGVRGVVVHNFAKGWSLSSRITMQSGRDAFTQGVYRNAIYPSFELSKRYGADHFLLIEAQCGYNDSGLARSTTREAYELTGDNYYNPAWGFYDGRVRNSSTRTTLSPRFDVCYQLPLADVSYLTFEAKAHFDRRSYGSLGWYNATTPMPDYYRKMPSFMTPGTVRDYVEELWQASDSDYTQINWEQLVHLNTLARDGSAYYTVESRTEQIYIAELQAMHTTTIAQRLNLSYGFNISHTARRNFKVLDDLLGAEFLLDKDQFIGDNYNSTRDLDNDIQNPNRRVAKGERFGYDYALSQSCAKALVRAEFTSSAFDFNLDANISSHYTSRVGHYEKERFAGAASLGASQGISQAPYMLRFSMGYALRPNQYLALKVLQARESAQARSLFLDPSMANVLSPIGGGQSLSSLALSYRYSRYAFSLYGEIYALRRVGDSRIAYSYDDLTSTMSRAVIADVNSHSIGAEIVASLRMGDDTSLSATLAAGHYAYDDVASVALYNEYDLSCFSQPSIASVEGVKIGNAPQIIATTTCTYFGLKRYILSASASYSALRYAEPSIIRRSERLLEQAFLSDESRAECCEQECLPDILDMEIGISRFIYTERGGRVMLRASISNLLGSRDGIIYARESDRVSLLRDNGYFAGANLRATTYQYEAPRRFLFSISYQF